MPKAAVHRLEVRAQPGRTDPRADALLQEARSIHLPLNAAATARVYLIQAQLQARDTDRLCRRLLADPVRESATVGALAPAPDARVIEVHPLPGVMDPAAQSVRDAIRDLLGIDAAVSTGWRYDLTGLSRAQADALARRLLANPVIHAIHDQPFTPDRLPSGLTYELNITHIPLRDLSDDQLSTLSRESHLFLSLGEMLAIQTEYRRLEREPTDIELETLAQTWSEHCVHKTLKSRIRYRSDEAIPARRERSDGGVEKRPRDEETKRRSGGGDVIEWAGRPGHTVQPDGSVIIDNLLRSTVVAATNELIADGLDWTISVFVDNAGIIAFDDDTAVCVKVETHNHPSAIEPYGGAATGIGGCIRDIIGTGLAAKPIASTDVFCVAHPDLDDIPTGCLHPRRVLTQVVAGVRDYGNRMGIPTVNGAVHFDDRYVGNPLVFCGCVGVMPRDRVAGDPKPGDLIVVLGGRTGRDGIHGATFSSAELTDTHADEFSHAVQIGNAIEEKRVLDAILRARDEHAKPLFSAITDCGAGGFSSAVGEMGETLGTQVHLEKAPLKYEGLSYTEIWISEAQERMVLAVPESNLDPLRRICAEEHVELAVLGSFGTPNAELVLNYDGTEVGRLPMDFLHNGIPTPTREATWNRAPCGSRGSTQNRAPCGSRGSSQNRAPCGSRGSNATAALDSHKAPKSRTPPAPAGGSVGNTDLQSTLLALLAHPDIASKHFIVRQYDHEVQGNVVIKPLVGPGGIGPADASVIEPVPGSGRGLAIACGLQTGVGDPESGGDPYLMALAAIDECVRNLVCVGADPSRIAILDNFCWPSCTDPANLGSLVRAAEGCYDAAKAYRTPFVSGKDSLNNQFTTEDGTTIAIPPTLLITGIGIVNDVNKCVTTDLKRTDSRIALVGVTKPEGSPAEVLAAQVNAARFIAGAIERGLVLACHDVSDGGVLCALAEMLIGGSTPDRPIGAQAVLDTEDTTVHAAAFAESPARYLIETPDEDGEFLRFIELLGVASDPNLDYYILATTNDSGVLRVEDANIDVPVTDLEAAWRGTLDW